MTISMLHQPLFLFRSADTPLFARGTGIVEGVE